jgi:hypothetical protein
MRSPVSRSPLGECNAIKSSGFGDSELTFDPNVFPQARFWTVSGLPTIRKPSPSGPNAISGYSHFHV